MLAPGAQIELEIGCADAQFLFERAEALAAAGGPASAFVGLEIREGLVHQVNARARELGVPVQAVFCNANHHLAALLPAGSVARVFLNFPDPWFKRRHHKRRMIDRSLLLQVHEVLLPGGELFFQSDVWELTLETLALLESLDGRFANRAGAWSFWKDGNPYGVRSWREAHCEADGLPIWRLWYRRLATDR